MTETTTALTSAEEMVNVTFGRIHDAINQACTVAEANVASPYQDWQSGARLYLDFCTFAMQRAQPIALSNPNRCAGEIRRSRICLKKITRGIPPGKKFPQPIIDSVAMVNAEIDAGLVELKAARALNRENHNG